MNKKIVGLLMAGMIAIAAIFVVTAKDQTDQENDQADIQDIPPTISGIPTYQYVAKFACGLVQPNTESAKIISPGDYKTIVNIHNPQSSNVSLRKKVVIASAEEPRHPIAPSKFGLYRDLQPDFTFRIDCPDIYNMAGIIPGTFIEGFVVLFPSPSRQIDVTALYTAGAPLATSGGSIVTMDIETIKPKISVPATTTSYVDSPP
jgi:hypothetical protein